MVAVIEWLSYLIFTQYITHSRSANHWKMKVNIEFDLVPGLNYLNEGELQILLPYLYDYT